MRLVVYLAQILPALALSAVNRKACQYPTRNPLDGCPKNTLLVGPNEKFTTVQSAVLSLGNTTAASHILVLPGNYTEQVNVTRPGPLYLFGQTTSPNDQRKNSVNIIWRNATGAGIVPNIDNAYTSTLTVAPTFNASLTGTGPTGFAVPADTPFGNADFRAYNLNFINDFSDHAVGPALAISVSYANAGFYFCGFYSYQDTVYIGKLGNAYFYASEIAGQVDFLYGFGTAWIQSSQLTLRNCGGAITAWKGTNTTFENTYGIYIDSSSILKANASLALNHTCALGRPWNALHRSVVARTYLDGSILPAGYKEWVPTEPRIGVNTTMAEYANWGPGWDVGARVRGGVGKVLGREEYEKKGYGRLDRVFQWPGTGKGGNTAWIDRAPER